MFCIQLKKLKIKYEINGTRKTTILKKKKTPSSSREEGVFSCNDVPIFLIRDTVLKK